MEEFGPAKPIGAGDVNSTPNPDQKVDLLETKDYKLNVYSLKIETYSNGNINFKVQQKNIESPFYYFKEYNYEEILQKFILIKEHYENISKILKFFDIAISKNKINLLKDDKNKKMKLSLKKSMDFEEVECILELDEAEINNEDMLKLMMEQIRELKVKEMGSGGDKDIKKLIEDNEMMKSKIKYLTEENEKNKKEKEEMKNMIKIISDERKKDKETFEAKIKFLVSEIKKIKQKLEDNKIGESSSTVKKSNNDNFEQDPNKLKFKELLTNMNSGAGLLSNFAVYTGLKDDITYLVYNNKNTFNLDVMRIKDKAIIYSLKKHTKNVSVIKYYIKNNKEEYLLSCEKNFKNKTNNIIDSNKLVIIWDIQNNYNIKYIFQENILGNIYDALILYNISSKDYILISSDNKESIKLYELCDNVKFIYNIPGTNEYITNYMIPWIYNNNFYVIKLFSDISIYNIFRDECYAKLNYEKSKYYCGYIYNKNYLCANDRNNHYLRIWDLINKNIYKDIKYDVDVGREIVPWNNIYTIVSCYGYIAIVDIENGKLTNKIHIESSSLGGVKKVYLNQLGECIIVSDFAGNIKLFSL